MTDPNEQTIGPWTRLEKLGDGGNATVWKARRGARGRIVALKVLNTYRSRREPYRRFMREIDFLRSLDDSTGVLPLIDAFLPDKPSKTDRPWLAMPIATPIADALGGATLETVIAALAEIASTLARLTDEHGIAHRDIKPGNLYELDGTWLVGDFGLIAVPDVEELTRTGRPLGPAHFTAYELILDPTTADPHSADVYSFGKTLWVLSTEQTFPPQGHQPAETRQYSIADFRGHPHADGLDRLVDRATRIHPEERPTMAEFADDLRAWSELAVEPVAVDLSEVGGRLRQRLARELAEEDLLDQRKELALAATRRMNELFAPSNAALKRVHPRAVIDGLADRLTQNMLSTPTHSGSPDIVFKFQRMSQISSGPEFNLFALRFGRSLELTAEGLLIVRCYIDVGYVKTFGSDFTWRSAERSAPVGSVQADLMLQEAVEEVGPELEKGVEAFIDALPEET